MFPCIFWACDTAPRYHDGNDASHHRDWKVHQFSTSNWKTVCLKFGYKTLLVFERIKHFTLWKWWFTTTFYEQIEWNCIGNVLIRNNLFFVEVKLKMILSLLETKNSPILLNINWKHYVSSMILILKKNQVENVTFCLETSNFLSKIKIKRKCI